MCKIHTFLGHTCLQPASKRWVPSLQFRWKSSSRVTFKMLMLASLSIVLTSVMSSSNNNNSSISNSNNNKVESQKCGGCIIEDSNNNSSCCPHAQTYCGCQDPCVLDPPDVYSDPLNGISVEDDESLTILVNLTWPRRDLVWYLTAFKRIMIDEGISTPSPSGLYTKEDVSDILDFSRTAKLDHILKVIKRDITILQRSALRSGEKELWNKDRLELRIRKANITFTKDSATLKHQVAFRRTDPISTRMARLGTITGGATRYFARWLQLPAPSTVGLVFIGQLPDCTEKFDQLKRPVLVKSCDPNIPFRTLDGSCNNVVNILKGSAFTSFRRDLGPVYDDGIDSFRRAVNGRELPSARLISSLVNNARSEESPSFSILHMTYGQFIDHDLTATPIARASFSGYEISESPIMCCNIGWLFMHPECASISIPKNDPFFGCFDQSCMEFVRSAPAERNCFQGPREQTNQQTAYLDGSVIYGVNPSETNELRTFENGLLNGQILRDGQLLLPPSTADYDKECNAQEREDMGQFCFLAGDSRANEQILLTFFHTLWAREHNRVAMILRDSNPADWNDEKIFQETRRIVSAQLQQVTFGEYLPTVIGPMLTASSRLNPLKGDQQTTDYDNQIDASIANSFAAAAYRFGHSLIADNLLLITKQGKVTPKQLSTLFFNPFELYRKGAMSEIARGTLNLPENKMDPFFTQEVAGRLFRGPRPFGLDLVSMNIQRGRDHGLPPFNSWRVFCGLPRAKTFQDLRDQMSQDRIDALEEVYNHVDDIDLFIGGVSENPLPGALLGHTFTCLVHNQFFRMRFGDRYWFEYRDGPGNFTKAQIEQLHNVTLARIMCNNLPELDYIQRWPLRNPGPDNPRVCCKSIRQYNLNPWKPHFNEGDDDNDHQHKKEDDDNDGSEHDDNSDDGEDMTMSEE